MVFLGVILYNFVPSLWFNIYTFWVNIKSFYGFKPWWVHTIKSYIVENSGVAYHLRNLTLFTVEYDHYWGQKNKSYGKLSSLIYPHVGGVLYTNWRFHSVRSSICVFVRVPLFFLLVSKWVSMVCQESLKGVWSWKGVSKNFKGCLKEV